MGHETVDWDFFGQAIQHAKALAFFSNSFFGTAMKSIGDPVNLIVSMKKAPLVAGGNPGSEFLSYVNDSHFRDAGDVRDKLFGLLGLVTADIGIRVDYDSPGSEVFIRSTRALAEVLEDLDFLGFCYPYKIGNLETPLPSWVPQWGSTGTLARPMMNLANGDRRSSHASQGMPCTPHWSEDGKTMILEGFIVDTVKRLTPVLPSLYLNNTHEGSFAYMDEFDKAFLPDDPNQSLWDMCREIGGIVKATGKLISSGTA